MCMRVNTLRQNHHFPRSLVCFFPSSTEPRDRTLSNTQLNCQKLWRFIKNAVLLIVEMYFDVVCFAHS